MASYLAMTAQYGVYDGSRIIAEATGRDMLRVQAPAVDKTQGLVWYYEQFDDLLVGHSGSDPGTSAYAYINPTTGAGVAMVANGFWYGSRLAELAADQLLDTLLEEALTY